MVGGNKPGTNSQIVYQPISYGSLSWLMNLSASLSMMMMLMMNQKYTKGINQKNQKKNTIDWVANWLVYNEGKMIVVHSINSGFFLLLLL